MEHPEHQTSAFKTWLIVLFCVAIVLFQGWLAFTVIGDLGQPGVSYDNAYHVVTGANNAILDGFVVTGGVSGLGLSVARKFTAGGGRALLLDINDEAGAAAVAELGDAVSYIQTDVSSEQAVQGAVGAAIERMGSLNVAINCAGILGAGFV
mgnify:CR=1 FL=1